MVEKAYLACDVCIFTIKDNSLQILLIKRGAEPFKGKFALPGGIVEEGEELDDCAKRELFEETNFKAETLIRFGCYGGVNRDPRGRVLTIAYLALVDSDAISLKASDDAVDAKWFKTDNLPELAFDHNKIISDAITRLKELCWTSDIIKSILPENFSLSELQKAFDIILNKKLSQDEIKNWANKILF